MKAPKRVPWASRSELAELYELLFSPSSDAGAKQRGLARMSIYLSSPSCPAFLPLLHSLVTASLLPSPPGSSSESVSTRRMTCAMAIVRFVNGMVDPLQNGPYARPISHLAATIGIPPMLIAIRHRATHEDLPPLPLLLTSVNMAIDYLHHYAFLPMFASSSESDPLLGGYAGSSVPPSRQRADAAVKRWKKVMKERVRGKVVGEENETGRELRKARREFELLDVEDVAAVLCTPAGLVPVARRKRPGYSSSTPSAPLLQVWAPLIEHLTEINPSTPFALADAILSTIMEGGFVQARGGEDGVDEVEMNKEVESSKWCLATWLLWLWGQEGSLELKAEEKRALSKRILDSLLGGDVAIRKLHKRLSSLEPSLGNTRGLNSLLLEDDSDELKGLDDDEPMEEDLESRIREMERRLQSLQKRSSVKLDQALVTSGSSGLGGSLPAGWARVESWKECPIGLWTMA